MVQEILAFFKIPWIAAFTAVFFWWFLTGLILFIVKKVDEINQRAHKFVTLILCPVFFLGVYLYLTSLSNISLSSIYSAFFGSLLIWSWFELAFLSGFITGPSKELCPQGIDQIKRFSYALSTIAYSELLLFITLLSMVYLSTGANNTVGLWTFGILFFARICAKLNLFLGVDADNQISTTIGFTLLASLTTLALIEHWFMVVPLRDAELWKWMLPKQKKQLKLKKTNSENYVSEKIHGL